VWDFGGDEWMFFVLAAIATAVGGYLFYVPLDSVPVMRGSLARRFVLGSLPLVALVPTLIVLVRWADAKQVRGHADYTILFMLGGSAWVLVSCRLTQVLGISIRDDAIERDNPAALVAACGIILGVGLVYAGSNIGAGPSIWTTILPAFVATIALLSMTLLIELSGGSVADDITIDRDVASGLRVAGAVLGCAMILGRAAAGVWVSWEQTWTDFGLHGWPVVILALAAGLLHRKQRPTALRPRPDIVVYGIIPAAIFLVAGFAIVAADRHGLHPSLW
jgi:hypothetical protein